MMSKAQHEAKARAFAKRAEKIEEDYFKASESALKKYGSQGSLVSGAVRDHFPEGVKNRLRALAHGIGQLRAASVAHWEASGKRTPWRAEFNPAYR